MTLDECFKGCDKSEEDQADLLPKPTGWRLLLEPMQIEQVTKGGIVLPEESQQYAEAECSIGKVVRLGPDCYKAAKFSAPWCREGDYVLHARHVGQKIQVRHPDGGSKKYLLINDDDVRATIPDPVRIKGYV